MKFLQQSSKLKRKCFIKCRNRNVISILFFFTSVSLCEKKQTEERKNEEEEKNYCPHPFPKIKNTRNENMDLWLWKLFRVGPPKTDVYTTTAL